MTESNTYQNSRTDLAVLLDRAEKLVPMLKERAVETEQLGRLPDDVMGALTNAEFTRIYTPAIFGGLQLDWGAHCHVAEELARGCGASAWIVAVVLSHPWMVARFCQKAQYDVFEGAADEIIASAFAGKSEMKKVRGGYTISGTWAFASGIHHAGWCIVGAPVIETTDEVPNVRPPYRMALLKAGQYSVIDDWQAEGLRGTGSNSVTITEQFVPDHLTIKSDDMTQASPGGAKLHDSYIYEVEFVPYLESSFLGPLIGSAKAALEEYLAITKSRRGREFGERVAEQEGVQVRVAESVMDIKVADRMIKHVLQGLHQDGAAGRIISGERWVLQRLTFSYAARLAVRAIDRLVSMMGAEGQIGHNPVQRHYRDIRAIAAHTSLIWDRAAVPAGKWVLGLPTGDRAVDDAGVDFSV